MAFFCLPRSPEDIDLFPAAMAETLLDGALVGPTFACLIAKQFQLLKVGDRFWHEVEDQGKTRRTAFTLGMYKVAYAKVKYTVLY